MAWTTPKTNFNAGDVLTAAEMNAIGANLNALPRVLSAGSMVTTAISIANADDYAMIEVVITARSNAAATNDVIKVVVNSDTGANYDSQYGYISNVLTATPATAQTHGVIGLCTGANSTASFNSSYRVTLPDPGNASYKTVHSYGGFTQTGGVFTSYGFNQWRSTAAITSLTFSLTTGTAYAAGSSYTVIGYPYIT